MSWTQGVLPREEMTDRQIERLENGYKLRTGESAKVEYITWFEMDGSDAVAHFDSNRGFKIGSRNAHNANRD